MLVTNILDQTGYCTQCREGDWSRKPPSLQREPCSWGLDGCQIAYIYLLLCLLLLLLQLLPPLKVHWFIGQVVELHMLVEHQSDPEWVAPVRRPDLFNHILI